MIVRRALSILVLVLVATSCSGSSADDTFPPITSEEDSTATSAATTSSSPGELDEAQVARLWEQLLTVFEASAAERERVAAALPDRLPTEEALRLSELYFLTGEASDLTSNAVFSQRSDGSVEIADCTDSSGPSVLGPTTAGFTAVVKLSPTGEVAITELTAVPRCVQRGPGQAAIDNYHLFRQANDEFWTDPRTDHPAIGEHSTERATEAFRSYVAELEELELLSGAVENHDAIKRGVEIVGSEPNEIRLRVCEHGDETVGRFDAEGQRTDLAEPPWRSEMTVRMKQRDGEWLFDELISRIEGDCVMGTSQFGLQLL